LQARGPPTRDPDRAQTAASRRRRRTPGATPALARDGPRRTPGAEAGGRGERTSRTPAQAQGRALASLWRAAAEVWGDSHTAAGCAPPLPDTRDRSDRAPGPLALLPLRRHGA